MNNNYTPTSNASGIIQAPKEARYFIQRMSRQGKSEGRWIFCSPLLPVHGYLQKEGAEFWIREEVACYPEGTKFRVQLAEVFI